LTITMKRMLKILRFRGRDDPRLCQHDEQGVAKSTRAYEIFLGRIGRQGGSG
jgi:hypothetical protein